MTSQWTDFFPFVQRVLERFPDLVDRLPRAERRALGSALASFFAINAGSRQHLPASCQWMQTKPMRYRLADAVHGMLRKVPTLCRLLQHSARRLVPSNHLPNHVGPTSSRER